MSEDLVWSDILNGAMVDLCSMNSQNKFVEIIESLHSLVNLEEIILIARQRNYLLIVGRAAAYILLYLQDLHALFNVHYVTPKMQRFPLPRPHTRQHSQSQIVTS